MAYPETDLNLTDEQKLPRAMVKKFGVEIMRPAGIELNELIDQAHRIMHLWRAGDVQKVDSCMRMRREEE